MCVCVCVCECVCVSSVSVFLSLYLSFSLLSLCPRSTSIYMHARDCLRLPGVRLCSPASVRVPRHPCLPVCACLGLAIFLPAYSHKAARLFQTCFAYRSVILHHASKNQPQCSGTRDLSAIFDVYLSLINDNNITTSPNHRQVAFSIFYKPNIFS